MMDVYHPDFRKSIAVDARIKSVSDVLGLKFSTYEAEESFYRDVAAVSGLEAWELDRLIYNFGDDVIAAFQARRLRG